MELLQHRLLTKPVVFTALALLATAAGAILLIACSSEGGSQGVSSPLFTAAPPTPVPSPVITTGRAPAGAVDVVREFWSQADAGLIQEAHETTIAPGSPLEDWTGEEIVSARLVKVWPVLVAAPESGATVTFDADVWVKAAGVTPWGEPGSHTLFFSVVRMSDGSWRLWSFSTSPP